MVYRALLGVLLLWLLSQSISYSQEPIKVSELQETTIGPIPEVNWIFHVDAIEGYVGIVSNERKLFQLYGSDGATVFERKAQADEQAIYLKVGLRDNPGKVLLIEGWGSRSFECVVLDYAGNLLAGPVRSENIVAVSPGGQYFYSVKDIGNDAATASVYDATGNRLALFTNDGGAWDLKAISDSLVLYRDADHIRILAVPEMVVRSEMTAEAGTLSDLQMSALSPDGAWYAYPQFETIVVCDLVAKVSYTIPKEVINVSPLRPDLAISNNGSFLTMFMITSRGDEVLVYRRKENAYVRLGHQLDIAPGYRFQGIVGGWFATDSICALSFAFVGSQGIEFFSYIFDATTAGDDLKGQLMEGLLTRDLPDADGTPRFRTTILAGQKAVTKIVQLRGRD